MNINNCNVIIMSCYCISKIFIQQQNCSHKITKSSVTSDKIQHIKPVVAHVCYFYTELQL